MSKISLAPDVAGTGIFTIASPNSNTNRTLTLPDDTGTIVTNSGNQAGSFTTLNTSGAVVFNDAGANVDFRVEGDTDANLLFVDASTDRVGIGTDSPEQRLHIGGNNGIRFGNASSTPKADINYTSGGLEFLDFKIQGTTAGYGNIRFYTGGTPDERMIIDASGNVGIGTTTPNIYSLTTYKRITLSDSASSGYGILTLAGGSGGGGEIDFGNQTVRQAGIASLDGSILGFYTNGTNSGTSLTERMRITSGGSLLVGATSGVGSRIFYVKASSGLQGYLDTDGANTQLTFGQSGGDKAYIFTDNANTRFYVQSGNSGGVYLADGGTSWTSASDERLKENLEPIENGLTKVASLRAVTGNYINDETKKSKAFLIAQDVQKVLPQAVDASNPEELGLQYVDVIPLLVASIQELKAELDTVKAELATLKGQ